MNLDDENILKVKTNRTFLLIPLDIAYNILARLGIENDDNLVIVGVIVGLDEFDLEYLKSCGFYRSLKFNLLKSNHNISELFIGGHKKRVKKYNVLVRKLVLRSPERFASLTAPYASHKFLPESHSDCTTREPAYYYPIDVPSVEFWNRVHETDKMLMRFKVANLWKRRESFHEEETKHVDDRIANLAFRMEHQFAKILLLQNLHFNKK